MNIPEVDQNTVANMTSAIPRVRAEIGLGVVAIVVEILLPRVASSVFEILMICLFSAARKLPVEGTPL